MTDEPSAEALAEQIGAVEETIAELRVDPLLYHDQAGPVIDLRIARLTAVIATLKERAAAYRGGIEEAAKAAAGLDPGRHAHSNVAAAYLQGRRDASTDVRALAPPQETMKPNQVCPYGCTHPYCKGRAIKPFVSWCQVAPPQEES